jgi:hypothetical protein
MSIFPSQFDKDKNFSWMFFFNISIIIVIFISIGIYNYHNNKKILTIFKETFSRFKATNDNFLKKINIIPLENSWTVEYHSNLKNNPLPLEEIQNEIRTMNQYYNIKIHNENHYIVYVCSNIVDKEDIKKITAILETYYNKSLIQ